MSEAEACLTPEILFLSFGRMVGMAERGFLAEGGLAVVSDGWVPVLGPVGWRLEPGDPVSAGAMER